MSRIQTFREFYPYYQSQHRKTSTRLMHLLGTTVFLGAASWAAVTANLKLVPAGVTAAYALAWVAHFTMECNRPATFKYPLWSLAADFTMFARILTGREPLRGT
ncbi:hypothetical protein V8C86DRAFT_3144309 [Haematococcus lacustris]